MSYKIKLICINYLFLSADKIGEIMTLSTTQSYILGNEFKSSIDSNESGGIPLKDINDDIEIVHNVSQSLFLEIYGRYPSINMINLYKDKVGNCIVLQTNDVIESLTIKVIRYDITDYNMSVRYANEHIGYFNTFTSKCKKTSIEDYAVGNNKFIISRMNTTKMPWTFYLHSSIPDKYRNSIKNGILSWNLYFKEIGYPNAINVSDNIINNVIPELKQWIVSCYCKNTINCPYSATTRFAIDPRTGEMLSGHIYMCLDKLESTPSRHYLMSMYKDVKLLETLINLYIENVTCHEVGHSLGLRHMFSGTFYLNEYGSVMDYTDIFAYIGLAKDLQDFEKCIKSLDIKNLNRQYDLEALKYGYSKESPTESSSESSFENVPFTSDENVYENIWTISETHKHSKNPLEYVDKSLEIYAQYRKNLLYMLKKDEISKFTYNALFVYIYYNCYKMLFDICAKYIGGRYFAYNKKSYSYISKDKMYEALDKMFIIIDSIKYTYEEYTHIVYNIKATIRSTDIVAIDESIYTMGKGNLKQYYNNLIGYMMKKILVTNGISLGSPLKYLDMLEYCIKNCIFKTYMSSYTMKRLFIEQMNMLITNSGDKSIDKSIISTNSTDGSTDNIPEIMYILNGIHETVCKYLEILLQDENNLIFIKHQIINLMFMEKMIKHD